MIRTVKTIRGKNSKLRVRQVNEEKPLNIEQ